MSQLDKWKLGGVTPAKAAVAVIHKGKLGHIVKSQRYVGFRAHVRRLLAEMYPNDWRSFGTRSFSSGVMVELGKLLKLDYQDIPPWAETDIADYTVACNTPAPDEPGDAPCAPVHLSPSEWAAAAHRRLNEIRVTIDATKAINQLKELQMTLKTQTAKLFETRAFINGVDAATLTDDQIFQAIAQAEHQIKELEMIENKPAKLGKKIDKAYKAIEKVKAYVDAR